MQAVTDTARRLAFLLVIVPSLLFAACWAVLACVAWFVLWLLTGQDSEPLLGIVLVPVAWAFRILPP